MKYKLLEILFCPNCMSELDLIVFSKTECEINNDKNFTQCNHYCSFHKIKLTGKETNNKIDCKTCQTIDIISGLLICKCNNWYPVVNRIPRLLSEDFYSRNDFINQYKDKIPKKIMNIKDTRLKNVENIESKSKVRDTFTFKWTKVPQWRVTTKEGIEYTKNQFLEVTDSKEFWLKDKRILDGGCGSGGFTYIAGSLGGEVVGIDITTDGVESAEKNTRKLNNVHIIQGDLFNLPFRPNIFDFIYSIGVLHHTPAPKNAFQELCKHLKSNGEITVTVYPKLTALREATDRLINRSASKLPPKLFYFMCWPFTLIAAITKKCSSKVNREINNKLIKIYYMDERTFQENNADIFDWFHPKYASHHTVNEILQWFKDEGIADAYSFLTNPVSVRGKKLA